MEFPPEWYAGANDFVVERSRQLDQGRSARRISFDQFALGRRQQSPIIGPIATLLDDGKVSTLVLRDALGGEPPLNSDAK
jgi:hypothetical protein